MAQDPGDRIDTIRDDLRSGGRDVTDAEADLLLDFSDRLRLLASEYTDYRHKKLLRHTVRMAEHADADLTAVPTDREAAEAVVRWIHRTYDNPETNRNYRTALRQDVLIEDVDRVWWDAIARMWTLGRHRRRGCQSRYGRRRRGVASPA